MSQLFLVNDHKASDYEHVARALDSTDYLKCQLRMILQVEVAPAFVFRIISPSGREDGWSEDHVQATIFEAMIPRRRPSFFGLLRRRACGQFVARHWTQLEPRLLPDDERRDQGKWEQ